MNWIVLVLLSSFITAGNSILDKRLMDGRTAHPFACTTSFGIVGLPVIVVGLLILPPIPWQERMMALAAGLLFVGAAWLYYDTIAREEISRLAPLMRLTTVQILLLSVVFLGETLTRQQQVAFGVMLVSSILLSLKANKGRVTFSRAALRMIPVTMLLAFDSVLMAHVYRSTSIWQGLVWDNLGILAGLSLVGGTMIWKQQVVWCSTDRRTWGVLILEQTIRLITGLAPAWAVANGVPLALLSGLSGAGLIWVWVLAILLLGEPVKRHDLLLKGGGVLGMALSVYWLT
jgi:uncharacterized membrane protein